VKRLALVVCLLSAASAFGQGGAVTAVPAITNTRGEPVPYAEVAVCASNPGALPNTPCSGNFATLSTDITLAVQCQTNVTPIGAISGAGCTNPGKSDGLGNVVAFAAPGQYWCEYFGGSISRPLVVPCFFASSGSAILNCPTAINGSLAAFTSTTNLSCDRQMGTDFNGNGFAQSWKYLGPVNGFFTVIGGAADPGTVPAYALPANAARAAAPATVPTPYYWHWPSTRCAIGQYWAVISQSTDANGNPHDFYGCTNAANSQVIQVNGAPLLTESPANIRNTATITCTNPSAGNIDCNATGATFAQAANPSAPTLTTGGSAGSTSRTYAIVGCEDALCAQHSAISSTTTIATSNATLSTSNYVKLTAYADTLYGYRFYIVCRTASAGTPSTTGVIASGVWKVFADTGQAGDGSNCASTYATNTTKLTDQCLSSSVNAGMNSMPGSPCGVDAPPATGIKTLSEEWTETFGAPGDTNNLQWTWIYQPASTTATLTGGELVMFTPASGTDNWAFLAESTPATPWTFEQVSQWMDYAGTGSAKAGLCVSDGTKLISFAVGQGGNLAVTEYNNATSGVAAPYSVQNFQTDGYKYFYIQDDGANLNFKLSYDGVNIIQVYTQGHTSFLANTSKIGPCINRGGQMAVDYLRETQ